MLARGGAERPGETTSTISLGGDAPEADYDEFTDQAGQEQLPPGTALLVVRRGPNAGSRFLLDHDITTAGRHRDSDIFLDDVTVSRRHAEFYRHGDRFSVTRCVCAVQCPIDHIEMRVLLILGVIP